MASTSRAWDRVTTSEEGDTDDCETLSGSEDIIVEEGTSVRTPKAARASDISTHVFVLHKDGSRASSSLAASIPRREA